MVGAVKVLAIPAPKQLSVETESAHNGMEEMG